MSESSLCPALIISAPASGAGKTTVTAAIAQYHRQQGKRVRIFKTGPDFIDPMILRCASGHPVYQLDLWMVGLAQCQALLFEASQQADLILIEGVMGLFDGNPSTADLSEAFNIPVMAVIDASAMAQTFGAVAAGLAQYRPGLPFAGVMANRVAGKLHGDMLAASLRPQEKLLGCIYRDPAIQLPERHLGLMQAKELADIEQQLQLAASQIATTELAQLPAQCRFVAPTEIAPHLTGSLSGMRIAVAQDLAFNFLYQANLDVLTQAGANVCWVSPMTDTALPAHIDACYLPGGYPELYASQLAANTAFKNSLLAAANQGIPILAECGGLLYLLEQLTCDSGDVHTMAGILLGAGTMHTRVSAVGQQGIRLDDLALSTAEGVTLGPELRGHSFHYSSAHIHCQQIGQAYTHPYQRPGELIYCHNNIMASYMHWYFPSNPQFFIAWFKRQLTATV
ncbi:cobyrinate a,c-diamide synthase [Motilimonas pumila]|uniref:Cobyrinate a,c-diamide synthase n=1 Tax=Motilimonas pumila TaxID=2303987 RepID=A0A418YCA5_9GAMM|nr:cobyrinate a,c-diamide synthase [Motilimonas pumila]RJG42106.1 cobyrinate a,c-diamide synthase [Motilimonas pumila]